MKHLKSISTKTNVAKKIELLNILLLDIKDLGLKVEVKSGTTAGNTFNGVTYYDPKFIYVYIEDKDNLLQSTGRQLYYNPVIEDITQTFKDHNMNIRSVRSGDNFVLFVFDKYGRSTDSESWKDL